MIIKEIITDKSKNLCINQYFKIIFLDPVHSEVPVTETHDSTRINSAVSSGRWLSSYCRTNISPILSPGPGSVVDIATAYGLDGPGIECRWERDFPHLSRPALRPTQPPVKWVTGLSRG